MQITVGVPGHVPNFDPATIPRWARRVDELGFDALSVSDRPSWTGLAPGARSHDYAGAPVDFAHRGRAFDTWLDRVRAAWSSAGDLGPQPATPGGPPLLFGGASTPTLRRITTHGSGWIAGGLTPAEVADFVDHLTGQRERRKSTRR